MDRMDIGFSSLVARQLEDNIGAGLTPPLFI